MEGAPTILIADDEPAIADGHAARLTDEYAVRTAYDGDTAVDLLDDTVDVVLLDRRMPGRSGDDVLEYIEANQLPCRVAMLTGVEPAEDIVDMGFDAYLVKPIDREDLHETVDELVRRPPAAVDEDILDVLGDPKARRCCAILSDRRLTAQEIAEETGYSLTTVYRRLNTLQQAGIIDGRSTLDPEGDHYKTFATVTDRIHVSIADGFEVELDHRDGGTA